MSTIQFLPWLRSGLAAGLKSPFDPKLPANPTLNLVARVGSDPSLPPTEIPQTVALRGPGHVLGLPAASVRRMVPADMETGAPTNHFVMVELSPATLPWAATPAAPDGKNLPPWLVLVVLRQDRARLGRGTLGPIVTIDEGEELPALSEAAAWAHVQVNLPDGQTVQEFMQATPNAAIARLMCARRLQAGTRYLAALVPAFAAGVQAGLGVEVTETTLRLAWEKKKVGTGGLVLPVYHSWSFATVATGTGDFEDLARQILPLAGADLPKDLGQVSVTVVDNGSEALAASPRPSGRFVYYGALSPKLARPAPATDSPLAASLQTTWKIATTDACYTPPVIGSIQADGDPVIPLSEAAPSWMRAINLDPALRAAASLGAEWVRQQQDALVASAWEQANGIQEANQATRHALLAAETGRFLGKKVRKLDDTEVVHLTRPLHPNLPASSTAVKAAGLSASTTIASVVSRSSLPTQLVSGELRRMIRPSSPVGRKLRSKTTPAGGLTSAFITATRTTGSSLQKLGSSTSVSSSADPALPTLADGLRDTLRSRYNGVETRLKARLNLPSTIASSLSLRPLKARPTFPTALASQLDSPAWLLPGIEDVPNDRVLLLQQDRAYIAAVLAGANDAMARELVWREYPFDHGWTFFRNFWARTDGSSDVATGIRRWSAWPPPAPSSSGDTVILLLKASLLLRFPDTLFYGWARNAAQPPVFSGTLGPGIRYAGFQRGTEAWSDWLFVLEQPISSPRFGLDLAVDPTKPPTLKTPNDLCWEHFGVTPDQYVSARADIPTLSGLKWGAEGASNARLTLQKPMRVVLNASPWLR